MSQKKEKYARKLEEHVSTTEKLAQGLEDRMNGLEFRIGNLSWELSELRAGQEAAYNLASECSNRLRASRKKAAEAEKEAQFWKFLVIGAAAVTSAMVLFTKATLPNAEAIQIPAEPFPAVQAVCAELPKESGEAQSFPWANKLEGCTVTYYDTCELCCGKTDGITFSGAQAVPYETCAVDPDIIPLGSSVVVDYGDGELHYCRAEDVGGGVKGSHIDICVESHEEARQMGVKEAMVYWFPAN